MKAVCHSDCITLSISYRKHAFYSGIYGYLENYPFILNVIEPLNQEMSPLGADEF